MSQTTDYPFQEHNHQNCQARVLAEAERICRSRGARLTRLRRHVLEIVSRSHAPVGAYDILEQMNSNGRRQALISVYRALDFLMDQGLVHRLSSLNAFIACMLSSRSHSALFLICRSCRTVAELYSSTVEKMIRNDAGNEGFIAENQMVEVRGVCRYCERGK